MNKFEATLTYSTWITAFTSILILFASMAQANVAPIQQRAPTSVTAITDADAGYDQAAYDECMDSDSNTNCEAI